jgi:serine/threonine protein kinase
VVTDPLTGEQSACKVIPKRKLVGKEDAEDVRREVRVLHHLSGHPHVVAFRGAYEDSQAVYIVMELCKGGELFDAVAKRGHFREREAAQCVATLLSVVAHCHGMCVALRDLKPENVLFLHEPGGGGGNAGGNGVAGGNGGHNGAGGDGGGGGGAIGGCDAAPLGAGWPRHLKVIDFGLSTFVSATDPGPLSELVGSPFYMAPEVLRRVSFFWLLFWC